MDKNVVFAVAGSGKTRKIIEGLDAEKRTLILTYTNNNYDNLKERIINQFGDLPGNVSIYTYYSFLYSFCYLPLLLSRVGARNINHQKPIPKRGVTKADIGYYTDHHNQLYGNRLALLVQEFALQEVKNRIEKYFDQLVIDEVQDIAGHDFNLINKLSEANVNVLFVGDFYQHTFDTSTDGSVNKNLHKRGYTHYQSRFSACLTRDEKSLIKCYRCSASVCAFIQNALGINMESARGDETNIKLVEDVDQINKIMQDDTIVKLFYQEHHKYDCVSNNWGASKGIDSYNDVCVVLNQNTLRLYRNANLSGLANSTKSRLYVAITRARGDVFFVPQALLNDYRKET